MITHLFLTFIFTAKKELVLVQVRAIDGEGSVKVVYPSKTDLSYEGIPVQFCEQ
jgi:hypothetical protein